MEIYEKYLTEEFEVPHISGKSVLKTNIKPVDRSFKNLPRDGSGKSKVRFQDWLGFKGNPGKAYDGKWYGYSHRAVAGFGIGDKVKDGDVIYKGKEYTIETDQQAKEAATMFRNEVS